MATAAAAAAVYNATDADQVTVSANHISVQLPQSISTSSGVYAVLLQTGNNSPLVYSVCTLHLIETRSRAVARIADRTAASTFGVTGPMVSRDVIGHVTI